MILNLTKSSIVIFDLDDTLYKEINYVHSAFCSISEKLFPIIKSDVYDELIYLFLQKADVFGTILKNYELTQFSKEDLLQIYRTHFPSISLHDNAKEILDRLRSDQIRLGLITDGRSITQRNKLKSLKIEELFNDIIVSEEFGSAKPNIRNYSFFEDKYKGCEFTYIADDTDKDFIAPNVLSWNSICILDDGTNIHKQNLHCDPMNAPKEFVQTFKDIKINYEF